MYLLKYKDKRDKLQYQNPTLSIVERVNDLLARMTLAEKIGQMTQIEKNSITPDEVATYFIGSILSGGGGYPTTNTPEMWVSMVRGFQEGALQTRLAIPLIYGVDAVHGHNNMHGAVIFPHNIGLGATRDVDLVERVAHVTAREMLATGIHWNFAPAVSVPQDIRWGRTFEGYSEQTELVSQMGAAYVRGLLLGAVSPSVKHFVGDGGTTWGSMKGYEWIPGMWVAPDDRWSIDQGATEVDEATLRAVHLPPYQAAIEAGAKNIMISYTSWDGLKMHGHKYLMTDVLKGELGFEGFLISDYKAIDQITADYYTCVVSSINAGLDMVMVPFDCRTFISTLTQAVEAGDVPLSRIDDAVRRILTVKFELGLFETPYADEELLPLVGCEAHREVAREAVRKSLVLLKDEAQTLPLRKDMPHILVAGQAADDIGMQCGGWTIEWQGKAGPITPGTTLLEAIQQSVSPETTVQYSVDGALEADQMAEIGIVVVGEPPYCEGEGDSNDLTLSEEHIALLERVRSRCHKLILILYSGRPLIITEQLAQCDALIAAWLPGTEAQGIADVLFGDYPFTGKLSYRWPHSMAQIPLSDEDEPLFAFGHGLG